MGGGVSIRVRENGELREVISTLSFKAFADRNSLKKFNREETKQAVGVKGVALVSDVVYLHAMLRRHTAAGEALGTDYSYSTSADTIVRQPRPQPQTSRAW